MRRGALCSLLLFGSAFVLNEGVTPRLEAREPVPALAIILTSDPRLTVDARNVLVTETTRIWDQAGVPLDWISSQAQPSARTDTLRVLALARPAAQVHAEAAVIGELVRVNESRIFARVSIADAERIASRLFPRTPLEHDQRIGLILGRVVAHEIGHYLLDTSTHAESGLMRARFDELAFANPRSRAFELDEAAVAWVQERLLRGLPLGPSATASTASDSSQLSPFSYRR